MPSFHSVLVIEDCIRINTNINQKKVVDYSFIKQKEIPSDIEINRKYCDADECKFMLMYHVVEQETQSNRHFISFIQIAELLGRTMVLTNVGQSGISSLKDFSFDFYYDVDELRNKFPKVKFISQHKFQKWAEERYNKPDIIHILLENSASNPNYIVKHNTEYFDRLLSEYRMDQFDLKLNNSAIFKQISIGRNARDSRKGNKDDRLKQFLATELESNAEVMLITHDQGQVDLMPRCSENLVAYLKNLSLKTGITNIYLATDYPLVKHKAQSHTFDNIGIKHHTAMKILNSSFIVNTWVSTRMLNYLHSYPVKRDLLQEELGGSGIQGIFDKLVLTNADYFIAGPKKCCRFKSTYTYTIMEAREELSKNNVTIKNIIDRWQL
ncbi:proteophosphoglycan 5 [Gigaspora margarita]|uniref:Proteophosphoglycan 5 n=1 Tax=Gigaspora margarita TaxID=4874 RepID=A0A8H4APY3_GIGMA|nr:proteophosphoglycan 5 [Gigaspora margarita]